MSSVQLYRYDISGGMARQLSQSFLGRYVEAIWHTGIVVFGREYYFDGGVGIVSERAGGTRFGRPLRVDTLGVTQKNAVEFERWVVHMRSTMFGPMDYNLLQRNCNHFTQEASMFLLGIGIGDDIRNMIRDLLSTPMGSMIRPMLEQMTHSGGGAAGGLLSHGLSMPPPPSPTTVAPAPSSGLLSAKAGLTPDELETLQLALAILESSIETEAGANSLRLSLQTLTTVLQQILAEPRLAKYRRIKTTSPTFHDKILAGQPAVFSEPVSDVLTVAGFVNVTEGDSTYFSLNDANGSAAVLAQVRDALEQAIEALTPRPAHPVAQSLTAPPVAATTAVSTATLRWVPLPSLSPQSPPLSVGHEGGAEVYMVRVQGHFGKAPLTRTANGYTLQGAHVLAPTGGRNLGEVSSWREAAVLKDANPQQVDVLCLSGADTSSVVWLPLWLMQVAACWSAAPATSDGVRGLRSTHGDGVHPAASFPFNLTTSASVGCVVIPYGGHCVDVTPTSEVLCVEAALPETVRRRWSAVQHDKLLRQRKRQRVCAPIRSIDDLLAWTPPAEDAAHRLSHWPWVVRRRSRPSGFAPRMLVCHDFKGGYHQEDQATFTVSTGAQPSASTTAPPPPWNAYTFHAWDHTDMFVYFSHARISIPPIDWVTAGHRHGVPVLGTFITEWETGRAEWTSILTNPQRMSAVIKQLVDVADHFHFNGYLLNVENEVAAQHVQRLTAFVKFLRKGLKERLGEERGLVVWYDAVTTEGRLSFQNALNDKNKCFFDAADAIFLNYFWRPSSLDLSAQHSGDRNSDVYVGVDCFGRSTYGGGGYDCNVALTEIAQRRQSVALFAPGWTLENASGGTWDGFLKADAKFWSRLSPQLGAPRPVVQAASQLAPLHTSAVQPLLLLSFSRGAGTTFWMNGEELNGTGRWVQRAGTSSSSLPCGQRKVDDATGAECWALPMVDDTTCVVSTEISATHKAQLLSHPTPFMGDSFLALRGAEGASSGWVQLVEFEAATTLPSTSRTLVLDVVWRRVEGDTESITMVGITVAVSDTTAATPALSMLTSMLSTEDESTTTLPGGWRRTTCTWDLRELMLPEKASVSIVSLQVTAPLPTEGLDVGCVALGSSALHLPKEAAVPLVAVDCTDVTFVCGSSASSGSLQLTFLSSFPTTDTHLAPMHIVATIRLPSSTVRTYLGEHLVPMVAGGSAQSAPISVTSPPAVLVDVDVVFPADMIATVELIESISVHSVPLLGWVEGGSRVVWRR